MTRPSRIATIVPFLLLCLMATAAAQTTRDVQSQQKSEEQAQPDSRDNGVNAVGGFFKAILDAKAREDRRRKAEAERRRREQETEQPAGETRDTVERQEPAPVDVTPVRREPAVQTTTPKRVPKKPKVVPPKIVVPRPVSPPVVAAPAPAVPPKPVFHAAPVVLSPAVAMAPHEEGAPWAWIVAIVGGLLLLGSAGYAARHWLGFGAPVPSVRAFADVGDPAPPQFDSDGPAIAFMLAMPPFTTATDYPGSEP